jgi:hypothetical protein
VKSIQELQQTLHTRYLSALNLYRFTQQSAFQHAYLVASDDRKKKAVRLIEEVDQIGLAYWTKTILKEHKQYELLDVRHLRELAQDAGIRGYAIMSRLDLVFRLQKHGSETKNEQAACDRTSG